MWWKDDAFLGLQFARAGQQSCHRAKSSPQLAVHHGLQRYALSQQDPIFDLFGNMNCRLPVRKPLAPGFREDRRLSRSPPAATTRFHHAARRRGGAIRWRG
jgi:hypothetical protein